MQAKTIKFFDTTLRDGEQTPNVHLSGNHKLEIAIQLEKLGIDIIEAGFPASSKGDFKAVTMIANTVKNSIITALARTTFSDIDLAYDAIKSAKYPRIHTFIATSDIHMKYKLHMNREDVLCRTVEMVKYAKALCEDVEFSPEDASRSNPEFLYEVIESAINSGATTINIPDTVGYMTPSEFGTLIKNIRQNVSNIDRATISVHCHDDLGLAVANSLSAIENGAEQVECAINGIGERAGNAAFEEIVMALHTRKDYYNAVFNIDTTQIIRTSRLVSSLTSLNVSPNKAVVGLNAFLHESGIHQHGVLCEKSTYEIMLPETIGLTSNNLIIGKLSGSHAFGERIRELGYTLDENAKMVCFERFKEYADKKRSVSDEDIMAIVNEYLDTMNVIYEVDTFQIQSGNKSKAMAMISLIKKGEHISEAAIGDGPIDAAFNAVNKLSGTENIKLESYNIKAVTEGTDALGEATVKINIDGAYYNGRSVSTDIIEASIKAYVNALNKWEWQREMSSILT